jgi:glycosyltransferase involved in cell wall biosynthesis
VTARVAVIIPARNEETSIGLLLQHLPRIGNGWKIEPVIVVDAASTDKTAQIAAQNGATILTEPRAGYGRACLRGIEFLKNSSEQPEIVAFLDADFSDDPAEIGKILQPILENRADFSLGARKTSLAPHQKFGNRLATFLIRLLFGHKFHDLGPFRAIRFDALERLQMRDETFGWTVEMQIKAVKHKLRTVEIPVSYRQRVGKSKISGTISGSFRAGAKILATIFRLRLQN